MKKLAILALLLTASIITYRQFAIAGPGWPGGCGRYAEQNLTPEELQARDNFFSDTRELREKLFAKRAEYFEVLNQEDPDKEMAAAIWSEIFDLQTQLRDLAEDAGLGIGLGPDAGPEWRAGCGKGCGLRGGETPCDGNCDEQTQCDNPSCRWNR